MIKTLNEFIIEKQNEYPNAKGDFSGILAAISLVGRIINRAINIAGLSQDIIGYSDSINVQDEQQMKLDVYANNIMKKCLIDHEGIAAFASEEEDDFVSFNTERAKNANYILVTDPIDGSSNIDINVPVGTIFSIYRRVSNTNQPVSVDDFLQKGIKQVAAGYIIYGTSTMLVFSTGNGVNAFTYDPSLGSFCLSHQNIKLPEDGTLYSVNEGQYLKFPEGIKKYIKYCQEEDKASNRPYTLRYVGSLVADFHRSLFKGGVFMYPSSTSYPDGKIRLLYEANPISFLAEQAGGFAIDGKNRILDLKPQKLHQRTPFIVGSKLMVEKVKEFCDKYNN